MLDLEQYFLPGVYFLFLLWLLLIRAAKYKIISFIAISSFFWNWAKLYQKIIAKKYSVIIKNLISPNDCFIRKSFVDRITYFFFPDEDIECAKYQDALLVNPVLEVSPAAAAAESLAELFFSPLDLIGNYIGKFCSQLFKHLSYFMQPFVFVSLLCFLLLIICMLFRYRIRLPFVCIEPVDRYNPGSILSGVREAVTDAVENVRDSDITSVTTIPLKSLDVDDDRKKLLLKYQKRDFSFMFKKKKKQI